MLFSILINLVPVTVNNFVIKYNGEDFAKYLIRFFIVFSILFFVKFKKVEKN